jgi:DNA-binding transcriptional MocR family regulator
MLIDSDQKDYAQPMPDVDKTPSPAFDQNRSSMDAAWFAAQIDEVSAQGIAACLARLVRRGDVAPGTRLPGIRDLGPLLHVSPATVSAAWSILRKASVIEGRGRQGSWVADVQRGPAPRRHTNVATLWPAHVVDLSLAVPDPALLPDLAPALLQAVRGSDFNIYSRKGITEELRAAVTPTWPFAAEEMLAVNGGYEGIRLLLAGVLVPGDIVALSEPSTERLLDLLDDFGVRVVPVEVDDEGPRPDSLAEAMLRRPTVFLFEPRATSRFGRSMTVARRDDLAAVLAGSSTVIIEDDGLGDIAATTQVSLGFSFPERTATVRSYAKTYGPDLRLAVVGGAAPILQRARGIQQFGSGWASRILQNAVAFLITDPETQRAVGAARRVYASRRQEMARLLKERGVRTTGQDGLSLSVHVADEEQALLVLAAHGIASIGGRAASVRAKTSFVRLGIGYPLADPAKIADAFALASQAL